MVLKIELDLTGIISPVSLLKYKTTIKTMSPGDILTLLISDEDVVNDLLLITERSADSVLNKKQMKNYTSIQIKKGHNN